MRRPAFTLIEMLVIIIITAVMAGIAVPEFAHRWEQEQFNAGLGAIEAFVAEARQTAIDTAATTTVTWNAGNAEFSAQGETVTPATDQPTALAPPPDAAAGPAAPRTLDLGDALQVRSFSAGTSAGTGMQSVRFRPDGSCDGAEIAVAGPAGELVQLVLMPSTGRVQEVDAQ